MGAHVLSLRRLWVSPFLNEPMCSFDALKRHLPPILPIACVCQIAPELHLKKSQALPLLYGQSISIHLDYLDGTECRVYTSADKIFLGLAEYRVGVLRSKKLLDTEKMFQILL